MGYPQFLINNYISTISDIEDFREFLYKKGIMSKHYIDNKLLLIYTKYEDNNVKTDLNLKNECRSLIINTETKQIVSYSCNTPICNLDAMNYLLDHNDIDKKIYKCYEGTLLSLFNHDNNWYLSTRRCLDSKESIWNGNSHFSLFEDVLQKDGFESFDDFTKSCDANYCYYFILIHYKNKCIVNYENEFGSEYSKLCLAFVRNKKNQDEVVFTAMKEIISTEHELKNIFFPKMVESLEEFNQNNNELSPEQYTECLDEGIIIKVESETGIKFLKLQTLSYQFNKSIGLEKNIYKGFLCLYQSGKLSNYLENNSNLSNYKKIINPINIQESYDTIGVVYSVFKVCTSELYELFKLLWNLKTGKKLNTDNSEKLYELLPKEYKTLLYGIRGIYFKNKSDNYMNKTNNRLYLQIKNIYQYLKSIEIDIFENFLRTRKLMYNWVKIDPNKNELIQFGKINDKCDKVHLKLTAIFTNKLFPYIMPDDIHFVKQI